MGGNGLRTYQLHIFIFKRKQTNESEKEECLQNILKKPVNILTNNKERVLWKPYI